MGEGYEGIPLEELRIDDIDWTHRAEHIRTRSERSAGRELDIEPEWATESAMDPRRFIRRAVGRRAIKVVGWSSLAADLEAPRGRLLKVWLVPKALSAGEWWGASACEANDSDRRAYERRSLHDR